MKRFGSFVSYGFLALGLTFAVLLFLNGTLAADRENSQATFLAPNSIPGSTPNRNPHKRVQVLGSIINEFWLRPSGRDSTLAPAQTQAPNNRLATHATWLSPIERKNPYCTDYNTSSGTLSIPSTPSLSNAVTESRSELPIMPVPENKSELPIARPLPKNESGLPIARPVLENGSVGQSTAEESQFHFQAQAPTSAPQLLEAHSLPAGSTMPYSQTNPFIFPGQADYFPPDQIWRIFGTLIEQPSYYLNSGRE